MADATCASVRRSSTRSMACIVCSTERYVPFMPARSRMAPSCARMSGERTSATSSGTITLKPSMHTSRPRRSSSFRCFAARAARFASPLTPRFRNSRCRVVNW